MFQNNKKRCQFEWFPGFTSKSRPGNTCLTVGRYRELISVNTSRYTSSDSYRDRLLEVTIAYLEASH